jgi:hypothetical protein
MAIQVRDVATVSWRGPVTQAQKWYHGFRVLGSRGGVQNSSTRFLLMDGVDAGDPNLGLGIVRKAGHRDG